MERQETRSESEGGHEPVREGPMGCRVDRMPLEYHSGGRTDSRQKRRHEGQEAVAGIQARGHDDLHQTRQSRSGKRGSDSWQTLKAKPVGFAGALMWGMGDREETRKSPRNLP